MVHLESTNDVSKPQNVLLNELYYFNCEAVLIITVGFMMSCHSDRVKLDKTLHRKAKINFF